ncbi:hypothetical protein XENOCAPTIV_002198 [Xenoophorus captivus]|uniref:RNA 3'-terminal phosphate cyclase insert domain-containing protein n=1 Tax=Xenoophorus captivus TaxID=1517983 RepID=A0ABV0SA20_9TELE
MGNRIVESARSILNQFLPDIYIYTDHMKGANSGKSPGFGLTLVAETLNGCFLSAEMSSTPQGQGDSVLPEDLGRNCAKLLLEEVYRVMFKIEVQKPSDDERKALCYTWRLGDKPCGKLGLCFAAEMMLKTLLITSRKDKCLEETYKDRKQRVHICVLNKLDEFEDAVRKAVRDVRLDNDVVVSVFETNIRVLGYKTNLTCLLYMLSMSCHVYHTENVCPVVFWGGM